MHTLYSKFYNDFKMFLEFFQWEITPIDDGVNHGFNLRQTETLRSLTHVGCPGMDLFDSIPPQTLFDSIDPKPLNRIEKNGSFQYLAEKESLKLGRIFQLLREKIIDTVFEIKLIGYPKDEKTKFIPSELVDKYTGILKDLKERGHFDGIITTYPTGVGCTALSLFFNGDSKIPMGIRDWVVQPLYCYESMSKYNWGTKGLPRLPSKDVADDVIKNTREIIPYEYEIRIERFDPSFLYTPAVSLWLVMDYFTAMIEDIHRNGIEYIDYY